MMTKTLMMKMLIVVATLIVLNSGWRSAKALILHTAFTQLREVPDDYDHDDDERVIGVCCKIACNMGWANRLWIGLTAFR